MRAVRHLNIPGPGFVKELTMRNLRSIPLVLATALATGCGGGGGTTPAAPSSSHGAAPIAPTGAQISAKLTLTIPAGKKSAARTHRGAPDRGTRGRSYVSEASLGAVVTATSTSHTFDNENYGFDLSASGVCDDPESGPETCTLSIPLYADSYSITIALYDQNESGKAATPAGNLLSIDTEPETIALGANNTLSNFLLHPQVDYFSEGGSTPQLQTFGAVGGTASSGISYAFVAQDADNFDVDFTGNPATYHNGPLPANAADVGDTTGCTPPCFHATNDVGTSPGGTPATISQASDETFTLAYTGGGGPGTGVKNSVGGAQPTGQRPYAGTVTAVAADGSSVAEIAPLFAYPASLSLGSTTAYVWAAQYAGAEHGESRRSVVFGVLRNARHDDVLGRARNDRDRRSRYVLPRLRHGLSRERRANRIVYVDPQRRRRPGRRRYRSGRREWRQHDRQRSVPERSRYPDGRFEASQARFCAVD